MLKRPQDYWRATRGRGGGRGGGRGRVIIVAFANELDAQSCKF